MWVCIVEWIQNRKVLKYVTDILGSLGGIAGRDQEGGAEEEGLGRRGPGGGTQEEGPTRTGLGGGAQKEGPGRRGLDETGVLD